MSDTFRGFAPPTKNYFPMPNEWIDICADINNLSELKVIFYILRHTWGYQEYGVFKAITFEEFENGRKRTDGSRIDKGTGLSRQSIIDGLKKAVRDGYIVDDTDKTDLARIKKSYAPKMLPADVEVQNLDPEFRGLVSIPQRSSIYTPEVKEVDPRGLNSRTRSEKDTLERHSRKTLKEKQEDASAIASAAHTPFQQEQAEQVHIAPSAQEEQEKRGQDGHTDLASRPSSHQPATRPAVDRTESMGLAAQSQEVSEVTQANQVAAVPSGRAKEVPAEEQKTPPVPRRTPPVHKETQPEKQSNLLDCPLTEPDMSGAWQAEKCVQYAEWCNNKRYKDAIRLKQVEAARKLHREDDDVTVAQFKLAYDDWKRWWDEKGKGSMHVSDLMVKQDNGFLRYQNALERLATAANKKPKTATTSGDKPRASVLVSEEQARKNMDKMRANVAAKQAALAASGK